MQLLIILQISINLCSSTGILDYQTIIFNFLVQNEKLLKQQKDKVSFAFNTEPLKINYTCYNTLE